jgi:hypothetical protein
MRLSENLEKIKQTLPKHVTLIAVSKTKPVSDILELYQAGHRDFGENKVQELTDKYNQLPKDIKWHMIGHLQRNKVKYIAPFVYLIHAVDSLKLLKEINKQALKNNRTINCLLQVKIASEETKFGLSKEEVSQLLIADEFKLLQNIHVIGLMGMATFTNDTDQIKNEFCELKDIFDSVKNIKYPNCEITQLSMGMSNDYQIAVSCGSTMVRIGSSIFGKRNY